MITNLTGIEVFIALTYLSCRNNALTNLDVSGNGSNNTLFFVTQGNPNLGCIFPNNFQHYLFDQGLHLVTGIRNNMKNVLMTMKDKILLGKRSVIKTINDQLKNIA